MISELTSSDGNSRLTIESVSSRTKIALQVNLNLEVEACEIQLILPNSWTEVITQMRALLDEIRSDLIVGKKTRSRLVVGNSGFAVAPYQGSDLIEQIGKQWYEYSFCKEPKVFFYSRFLLDVTVIDNFFESSLPN